MSHSGAGALPTGAVTLLFTDIEGSTNLLNDLGDAYGDLLAVHDRVLRQTWTEYGGVEVKSEGDAFFVAFASANDAVGAARAAQLALADTDWPSGRGPLVRMGLHRGTPRVRGRDYWGIDVHYAARLCAAAHGGQVLVSESVATAVDADVDDLGLHALKDFPAPRRLFHLRVGGKGRAEFPSPRSLRAGRTNLPDQLSSLVGRGEEVAQVSALLAASRLVTLTGPGGVGKTRLALHVGATLLDGADDGVWLAELAGLTDAAWLPGAVAAALGEALEPGNDLVETLARQVGDRGVLLVLDNCEHLIDAVARLAQTLLRRCPNLTVLATSREPLAIPGEAVYRVPSLSLPPAEVVEPDDVARYDAVRLFVDRAASHRPGFALDATIVGDVVAIVRRLDGIPLAVELATPWLRRVSLAELRARLEQNFALLSGGARTALDRQRTIAALTDWSYDRLPAEEQQLLNRLSVFAGGFDLAAVEAVCAEGFGADGVLVLGALVDKSLVQVDDVPGTLRYGLLETVRAYAADKLIATGAESVASLRSAHLRHFLGLAEQFASEPDRARVPEWLQRLTRDHDNLRGAVTRAMEDPDPQLALRLTSALSRFWFNTGHPAESSAALTAALERPGAERPTVARAAALLARSGLYMYPPSTVPGLLHDTAEAFAIAQAAGDDHLAAQAQHYRMWLFLRLGDLPSALAAADFGLSLGGADAVGELATRLLRGKAVVLMNMGEDARPVLVEAVEMSRRSGDAIETMRLLGQLGVAELAGGDVAAARAVLDESLDAAREMGMVNDALGIRINLGFAAHLGGDPTAALRYHLDSLDEAERTANYEAACYALLGVALTRSAAGEPDVAVRLHGAIDAYLAANGERFERFEAGVRDDDVARLRAQLGGDRFEDLHRDGSTLPFAQAITLARSDVPI